MQAVPVFDRPRNPTGDYIYQGNVGAGAFDHLDDDELSKTIALGAPSSSWVKNDPQDFKTHDTCSAEAFLHVLPFFKWGCRITRTLSGGRDEGARQCRSEAAAG